MRILAFDTTAITATCAVADIDENGQLDKYALFSVKNRLTHSENLMPMVESTFERFGCTMADIDRIAITTGPGSFTGVRIGVSTVKGLAMPRNIPCVAVSTLEALAANITPCAETIICAVMDARRQQFYNALFDEQGMRICDDRVISASELADELIATGKQIILCGDGAMLFKSLYPGVKEFKLAAAASLNQNALSVAICGSTKQTISHEKLLPVYLRPSQAEREQTEKL